MKKRPVVLGAVLAVVAAFALWQNRELIPGDMRPGTEVAQPRTPAASGPVAQAPAEPVEQVGESADSATPLQEILPRQSIAHQQGLHKTKDPLGLHSSAALVMDAGTRKVEYAKNESAVLPMASITKLMTAMVTLDANLPMEAPITITEDDMDRERHSRSRVKVGTVMSRSEALHLALMSSENRAAHALGRTYPDGLEKFVEAMNRKARQLGMNHTHYFDPTGLSASNQSTAQDLATLVLAASKYPQIRQFSTDEQYLTQVGNRNLRYLNSNRLVRSAGWDIDLQKTGYIIEAGHCVVMQAKLAGSEKVVVLLDADSNGRRNSDAERIRSWAYQQAGIPDERKLAKAKPAQKEEKKVAKAAAKEDAKDAKETKVAKKKEAASKDKETKVAAKSRAKEKEKEEPRVRKSFSASAERKVATKKREESGS
ncbi:serine hydrolase [Ramlibacter albus]|uniref:Serine hydrolase n=1 Tax=Ramlibacter albus TaxID=2079448 RepID=A0A923M6G7_9BURK|nr:serine hydrolase [Ramlibacter albus]MBC5764686.1 serine hydrolase [Ramlibacter albus]